MRNPLPCPGDPLRDRLVAGAFSCAWVVVPRLPEPVAYRLFRHAADLVWWRHGPGVRRLEGNLQRVLTWSAAMPGSTPGSPPGSTSGPPPGRDVRAVSRAATRSYLRYWCDAFRMPDWERDRVVDRVLVEGEHRLRDALAAGRGVVAALPHMGNWDHAGAWACRTGAPVTTVAERLRPEGLYERFAAFRTGLGMEILPLTGGDGPVFATLAARLREPRLVPLLADRELSTGGVLVSLAGEPARLPAGPAALALATGSALLPVSVHYAGDEPRHGIVLTFHEEVRAPVAAQRSTQLVAMTQGVADVFAAAFAAHPQDWHMWQAVWSADRDGPGPGP